MNFAAHRTTSSRRGGVTPRLAIFLALVCLPFVWFGYIFLNETLTGGIHHRAKFAEVDLKRLGHFNFDETNGTLSDVPARFRDLDGQRVRLEGFMSVRNTSADHVSDFEFVYNRTTCCILGPPRVQERVFVNAPNGDVPYCDEMVGIEGILHVNVVKEAGTVKSVYTLDLERVDPSP